MKHDPARTPEEVLRRLSVEAAAQEPELDWKRVEARLEALDGTPAPRARSGRTAWMVGSALAAAAALALVAGLQPSTAPLEPGLLSSVGPAPALQGGAREVVRGAAAGTWVEHEKARWWLAPDGEARVLEREGAVTVALLRGSLRAEVVPGGPPGRFRVEVGDGVVSVRGTIFRVERLPDGARVEVERGVVEVGPREGPWVSVAAPGVLTVDAAGRTPTAVSAPAVAGHDPPRRTLPRAPSPRDVEALLAEVSRVGSACVALPGQGVRVIVRTRFQGELLASGELSSYSFDPPLAPAVAECVAARLAALRVPPSREGARVTRALAFEP